ncbi:MAG: hypothetical protein V5B60_07645 [Accumulibacter sp.]|jgi:hypothetical protein|uniref:hypothetical protein n=1 Tax=Accumulibacter sp. TaxID=2053492 RepID=UPI002FC3A851
MQTAPEVGQLAIVRKRPFVVTEIIPSLPGLGGNASRPSHLVRLSSVEDDGLGEELQVIWEMEPGTAVHEKSTLPGPDSFDVPKRLQAFLDAVRWGAVSQADDKALQSPFRSGIEIDEYQLDPVVRALAMPRVNLLIADDVGRGDSIEISLILAALVRKRRIRRVLVLTQPSLRTHWREATESKFSPRLGNCQQGGYPQAAEGHGPGGQPLARVAPNHHVLPLTAPTRRPGAVHRQLRHNACPLVGAVALEPADRRRCAQAHAIAPALVVLDYAGCYGTLAEWRVCGSVRRGSTSGLDSFRDRSQWAECDGTDTEVDVDHCQYRCPGNSTANRAVATGPTREGTRGLMM